ncbi:cardiolipin synthase [Paenibacillus doosanensis]|uniref:Cardiolipin synthase n=1 Tax=Paenibacillus konkukensis TaxID=2020716 RepID=A0ABY4RS64_9BACL|nr:MULTISPECIES: cardiolipin synthase [Paenibacillus]MCS7459545.1 cardiolipin synthase [Paenibacillus doosanensis]UQZ84797.1 Major cardiolipin synthase ClsA [Paenibacillus konkukensis]
MHVWTAGLWKALNDWLPLINLLFAAAIIFLERRNVGVTWAWLMVLLLLPVAGFLLYIFLGQNLARQKVYRIRPRIEQTVREEMREQAQSLQRNTFAYNDPAVRDHRRLIYMNLMNGFSPLTQNNEVTLYTDGVEKFEALIQEIAGARLHIHLLYYKIGSDETGGRLVAALTAKAKEGVQVKLLYDDIGSLGVKRSMFDELRAAGGEVFPFFPAKIPYLNFRLNYRNHRKIAVIDGRSGFIGGFNIGNEYLGLDRSIGYWRDTHLKLQGDAVHRLQIQFLLDWGIASNQDSMVEKGMFPETQGNAKTAVQIVASGPHSARQQIKNGFIKFIFEAQRRIYIQTPYFIPDDSLLNALKIAALSGIDVRIMIPRKSDHRFVQWASFAYLGELLRAGANCYLYDNGFLHAKTMVVDGQAASVGTANMDRRSLELNFEINAFLFDADVASRLEHIFERDILHCQLLTLEHYDNRPALKRAAESVARLLSPIL